jgi:ribosome-associated protein
MRRPAGDRAYAPADGCSWAIMAAMDGDRWLRVSGSCRIDTRELEWRATRSGGPGGQHANTSDTKVEVRFDVAGSASLGPRQRERILERLGPVVRVSVATSRSQARNREVALARLADRLAEALRVEKPRRPTKPSRSARKKRVEQKRQRGATKRDRGRPGWDD